MLNIGPHRYHSAKGALQDLGGFLEPLGERALVIAGKTALDRFEDVIRASLKESMIGVSFEVCLGECCLPEIERLMDKVESEKADIIIGAGGGKTLDTAKYVGELSENSVVTVPTVASTCAGYTNKVYIFNEEGEFIKQETLSNCPDLLLLDYKVAGLAPSRFLAAGMANAYAVSRGIGLSQEDLKSSQPLQIAYELSGHIREGLQNQGGGAIADAKKGEVTSTIESIIEINILETGLVSCLGGKAFSANLAQMLANQLYRYCDEKVLSGELVGFGTLVTETLKGKDSEELKKLYEFYRDINIPLTLEELNLPENQRENIIEEAATEIVNQLEDWMFSFEITPKKLVKTVLKTDSRGQEIIQDGI
ncbi:MAG: iron-containing alcohol dehydrogenase family protein [bacterium]